MSNDIESLDQQPAANGAVPSTTTKDSNASRGTSSALWLVRIPKPAYDEGVLQSRQAEFKATVDRLREYNEKGASKGGKGKNAKRHTQGCGTHRANGVLILGVCLHKHGTLRTGTITRVQAAIHAAYIGFRGHSLQKTEPSSCSIINLVLKDTAHCTQARTHARVWVCAYAHAHATLCTDLHAQKCAHAYSHMNTHLPAHAHAQHI
eukprot:1151312-Pelagomonas_calceolata.AAC.6